ncbi:MAG: NF038122 family metalloprotease [Cyanobacteria bacterium P01_F01_bin.150]
MPYFNFTYDINVGLEQCLGFELAAAIWSQFLTDEVTINLHIVATDTLADGQAVGGAIPLFHEQHYGVYQEYVKQDATSVEDVLVLNSQQTGNTVDVLIGNEVVDGNSTILLTSAQAKALGMQERIQLENGTTWDRDLVDSNALDGYILINKGYDWNYDFTRQSDAPEGTLDFLTMALHEIGHALGFVSGIDGLMDMVELYSGQSHAQGFTPLDLLRYSDASLALDNPDGAVADLTGGIQSEFSLDGETALGTFSSGINGDGYQASHWERFQHALGIMDPTLGYQERTSISHLDLQAFDVLGWDVNYGVLEQGLDLHALYAQAKAVVAQDFGTSISAIDSALAHDQEWYTLGYSGWWQTLSTQMTLLGYGSVWDAFESDLVALAHVAFSDALESTLQEVGTERFWETLEAKILELGSGKFWQAAEATVLDLGSAKFWQNFEGQLLELRSAKFWQELEASFFELGSGKFWQSFEDQMLQLGSAKFWQSFELQMLELRSAKFWQELETDILALGPGKFWQTLESQVIEETSSDVLQTVETAFDLGSSGLWQALKSRILEEKAADAWQELETNLLDLRSGKFWQSLDIQLLELRSAKFWQELEDGLLELQSAKFWQTLDPFLATLDTAENAFNNEHHQVADGGVGGSNTVVFYSGNDDDIVAGDHKQDRIKSGGGDDLIDGKGGHDVLWGEEGRDIIYGQDGNDHIYGGADDDLLMGENDDDDLYGESGHDVISGGAGDDIVSGGEDNDDLHGGAGRDVVSGGEGDDRLDGGSNNDILIGGYGKDQADGGSGNDLIYGDNLSEPEAATLLELRQQLQQQSVDSDAESSTENSFTSTISANPIRVEVEDMSLSGNSEIYTGWKYDSEDIVRTSSTSTATTTFTGEAGRYLVVARYFDEDNGQASLSVTMNGDLLDNWTLDQDNDHYYTRTIAQEIQLNSGDAFTITLTANGNDEANFDYLEFVPLDGLFVTHLDPQPNTDSSNSNPSDSTSSSTDPFSASDFSSHFSSNSTSSTSSDSTANVDSETIRVEAESMTFIGDYSAANYSFASNGQLIEISNQGQGKALTAFAGTTGFYNIIVGYHDEDTDGTAHLSAHLNGIELDQWHLDQNIYSSSANSNNLVTRTVASGVVLSTGDIFELAGLRGEGRSDEAARVDYIEFVRIDNPTITSNETMTESTEPVINEVVISGDPIRIEAETMNLNGYSIENTSVASNNRLIRTSSSGTATTNFTGDTGYYNIIVAYYDEGDGLGQITANLAGTELDTWQLNQALGGIYASSDNFVTRTVATQIHVQTGDELILEGLREYNEFARIDYVEFIPVSAPVLNQSTSTSISTENDDFLQGGSGSDIVLGGEGNDIIYGESPFSNAVHVPNETELEYNDILVGGEGDDALYGNKGDDFLYGDSAENSTTSSLNNELVGHWTFDDADGTQVMDSAGDHTGSMIKMDTSQWTTGIVGGALEFDGGKERVEIGDRATLDITNTLTLATWVKADTFRDYSGLIVKGSDNIAYGLELMRDGSLSLETNYGSFTNASNYNYWGSEAKLTAGQWSHVAVTYDGSTVKFYIDGQLDSTHQADIVFGTNNESLVLGADLVEASNFDGVLDDARVYSRALSVHEINQIVAGESTSRSDASTESGNDVLYGGAGNDSLDGGAGNDVLDGSDAIALGISEQDTLIGGADADTFVLGSTLQSYYQDNGNADYALIKDFSSANDRLQLHGHSDSYHQQQQGDDLYLYYYGNSLDLVAIFENITTLDLNQISSFA